MDRGLICIHSLKVLPVMKTDGIQIAPNCLTINRKVRKSADISLHQIMMHVLFENKRYSTIQTTPSKHIHCCLIVVLVVPYE